MAALHHVEQVIDARRRYVPGSGKHRWIHAFEKLVFQTAWYRGPFVAMLSRQRSNAGEVAGRQPTDQFGLQGHLWSAINRSWPIFQVSRVDQPALVLPAGAVA